ncbi:hypothetical protein [Pseudonocardia adelaidensis]|uniref:Uncharacterized protein n=1 Tax=Pseudonocardia adelaidensis TaxID=648754 RepID=A0ABP9NQL7_9PSEU
MSDEQSREPEETTGSTGRTGPAHPARAAIQRSGGAVAGGAVGKTRSGVRGGANRLGRVASSTTASGGSAAGGLATTAGTAAAAAKDAGTTTAGTATGTAKGAVTATAGIAKGAVTTVTDKVAKPLLNGVGVGFALVVRKIMLFLRFLRQLALRLLDALEHLARRLQELAARYRGVEQQEVEDAGEDRGDRREPGTRPAPSQRPEGRRPRGPARPRPDAAPPDAPASAAPRRTPLAGRPERSGRRAPGAGGPKSS